MSATNSTTTISLPLFIGTDKPAWLTDWNGAMNIIDGAIATLQTAESGTATSLASLAQSVEALSGTVSQHTTAIQTVTTATAGNTGSINTINSLIGNGEPTTTDKTIIGAINELHSDQGDLADLTTPAVSLVAAINAITGGDAVEADDVTYDNTQSGLTATNVQAAIDEIAQSGATGTKTLKASSTAGGTYATQVAELASAFSSLSDDEKREAYIISVNGNNKSVYHVMAYGSAAVTFVNTYGTSNGIIAESLDLTNSEMILYKGSTSVDESATTFAGTLSLYA